MDSYDPRVAFDDVYAFSGGPNRVDVLGAMQAIMHSAGRRRLRAPVEILGASYDPTAKTFTPPDVILGGLDRVEYKQTGLPLFDTLQARFETALPQPKMVRVDDDVSYETWKESRRAPYIEKLDARLQALEDAFDYHLVPERSSRLSALEAAFERHASNPHAHNEVVVGALNEVAQCGTKVPLPIETGGAITCWRDGDEILCSVRMAAKDGVKIATTAVPTSRALEETLGAAVAANVPPETILLVTPSLAQVLGGMGLVPQLCRAAPELLGVDTPFVGVLRSNVDPELAAAMALVQRCQRGDPRACAETGALRQVRKRLVKKAEKRLLEGQRTHKGARR